MKIFYGFLLLCLSILSVKAQSFNSAGHTGTESTFNITGLNEKSYYLIRSTEVNSCCTDNALLVVKAANGSELFRKNILNASLISFGSVLPTAEKNLLIVAGTKIKGCDYGGPMFRVAKYDTVGNIIWSFTLNSEIVHSQTFPDGGFYLISRDSVFHYNGSGQILSAISAGLPLFTNVHSGCILSDGSILISYQNTSGSRFKILSSAGSSLTDIPVAGLSEHFRQAEDSSIYCISVGNLYKYSQDLSLVQNSSNILLFSYSVRSFCLRNDSVFVVGQLGGGVPVIYLFNSSLNVLSQGSSDLEQVTCTGIDLIGNRLAVISFGKTDLPVANSFSGYFQTSFSGVLNSQEDVGVTGIDAQYSKYYKAGMYSMVDISAQVIVKNYGPDTVYSFHLTHYDATGGISYCLLGLNQTFIKKIGPGDSAVVTTSVYTTVAGYSNLPAMLDYSVCLSTSVPNEMNDGNVNNDDFCTVIRISFTDITTYDGDRELEMFPNPSTGEVVLRAAGRLGKILIVNGTGNIVAEFTAEGDQFVIPAKSLPPGIYIIKIADHARTNSKLIIQ